MASQLYNYSPSELQEILDNCNSFKDVLRRLGMCDHGANYTTLKKIISEYNLDLTKISENRAEENRKLILNLHDRKEKTLEEILIENSTYTNGNNLKKRLFESGLKEYKCERCGLNEWLGEPIPLHLHHINGKHNDNRIENIELLCPNCHALTDTYSGKNIKHNKKEKKEKSTNIRKTAFKGVTSDGMRLYDGYGKYKVLCPVCKKIFKNKEAKMCSNCFKKEQRKPKILKEELFKIMETNSYYSAADMLGIDRETVSRWHKYYINKEKENGVINIGSDKAPSREELKEDIRNMSFLQVGKKYGVTDNAVRRWCDTYKLPRHAKEIKLISDEEWKLI